MDRWRASLGAIWLSLLAACGRADGASREKRSPGLERKARLVLTPQHTVHLLAAGGKTLVVGCSGQGFQVLCELNEPAAQQGSSREAAR